MSLVAAPGVSARSALQDVNGQSLLGGIVPNLQGSNWSLSSEKPPVPIVYDDTTFSGCIMGWAWFVYYLGTNSISVFLASAPLQIQPRILISSYLSGPDS